MGIAPMPARHPAGRAALAPRAPARAASARAPGHVSAPLVIDPLEHLKWARSIARGVRADYRFLAGSEEEAELEQTAYLVVVEYALRFDPGRVPPGGDAAGLFRGWAAVEVRSRCKREALRLRNGGTYHTTNDRAAKAIRVGGLPDRCESCASLTRQAEAAEVAEPDDAEDVSGWLVAHGY